MIKRDFPDTITEPHDSTEETINATEERECKYEVDKEKVVRKSHSSISSIVSTSSCRIPKASGLKCDICEVAFIGYISFYQHEV